MCFPQEHGGGGGHSWGLTDESQILTIISSWMLWDKHFEFGI
jgi:hypothetical protein